MIRNIKLNNIKISSIRTLNNITSSRTFFSKLFGNNNQPQQQMFTELSSIQFLARYKPTSAIKIIEDGWASGKIPFEEAYLREYFKACGELKRLDRVNITGLLTLLKSEQINPGGNMAMLGSLVNQSRSTAGSSPNEPSMF